MPKRKFEKKKKLLRPIHLHAILFLTIYTILSKTIFFSTIASDSLLVAFAGPYLFGALAGVVMLYFYSHEEFFHFMKDVEKIEKKKEEGYLNKYLHYGKVSAILVIGSLAGPLFSSLSARILINDKSYKYLLVLSANVFSTILHVGIARGLFDIMPYAGTSRS